MYTGVGNMKKADDKKSKSRRKRKKFKQKKRTERGRKIAENEDEEGEVKR